jgi:hypothetical protein
MRWALVLLALTACEASIQPTVPPRPAPPPDPTTLPDGTAASCESACLNLAALEPPGCGLDTATCVDDCRDASAAEESAGVRFPAGCLTQATSCAEAGQCR